MSDETEPIKMIETPTRLEYTYTPGRATTRYLCAIAEKRLLGQRCPGCGRVYVPSRGACARCGLPTEEEVDVADKGTVVSFTLVRVPSANIDLELPYATAAVLLDGADITFTALLSEVPIEEIRAGMRVQAVWVPDAELSISAKNIKWFRPIDEPDVPFEQFQEHL